MIVINKKVNPNSISRLSGGERCSSVALVRTTFKSQFSTTRPLSTNVPAAIYTDVEAKKKQFLRITKEEQAYIV